MARGGGRKAAEAAAGGGAVRIHPTALVEAGVRIGAGSAVWDHAHIRAGAVIGERCIIGGKTYIAPGVRIGRLVKLNAFVYVCAGVTIEDMVMVSAGTVFTNDRYPRAAHPELDQPVTSEVTEDTLSTTVRRGATIGANATIGPGLTLGDFCMIGMGAVVTKPVLPHQLVVGCPARAAGWVCVCGRWLGARADSAACRACGRRYTGGSAGIRLLGRAEDGPPGRAGRRERMAGTARLREGRVAMATGRAA